MPVDAVDRCRQRRRLHHPSPLTCRSGYATALLRRLADTADAALRVENEEKRRICETAQDQSSTPQPASSQSTVLTGDVLQFGQPKRLAHTGVAMKMEQESLLLIL
ncbi:hypothetical protein ACWD3K_35880 [Streptomyces sp. NPDC002778]